VAIVGAEGVGKSSLIMKYLYPDMSSSSDIERQRLLSKHKVTKYGDVKLSIHKLNVYIKPNWYGTVDMYNIIRMYDDGTINSGDGSKDPKYIYIAEPIKDPYDTYDIYYTGKHFVEYKPTKLSNVPLRCYDINYFDAIIYMYRNSHDLQMMEYALKTIKKYANIPIVTVCSGSNSMTFGGMYNVIPSALVDKNSIDKIFDDLVSKLLGKNVGLTKEFAENVVTKSINPNKETKYNIDVVLRFLKRKGIPISEKDNEDPNKLDIIEICI